MVELPMDNNNQARIASFAMQILKFHILLASNREETVKNLFKNFRRNLYDADSNCI